MYWELPLRRKVSKAFVLMEDTPKKITESESKCFLCSLDCPKNNRVLVFGKSALDIPKLLSVAIDIDLKTYSQSQELFICKTRCYKTLQQFSNCLQKFQRIKDEIKNQFNAQQIRTKRLLREDDLGQSSKQRNSSAAKSLDFSTTTSTSSGNINTNQNREFVPLIDPSSSNYAAFEQSLQHMIFPLPIPHHFPSVPTPSDHFVGGITSTPRSTSTQSTSTVRISIKYSSKTVNKYLDPKYESVGKSLYYGIPSAIATAVMKCEVLRKEVVKKVLTTVTQEVNGLCGRREPSLLRKCSRDDLMKFDFKSLCEEWQQRAPLFYSFLLCCSSKKSSSSTWFPSVAVAGSVLLKQRHPQMNATATVLGILLKSRSIEANLARLSKMKVTCANRTVLAKMDCLGENHASSFYKVQERITKEAAVLQEKQSALSTMKSAYAADPSNSSNSLSNILQAHREVESLKSSCHPGFVIAFDNIDMQLNRKNMTSTAQNRTFHWVNHKMVNNRVACSELPSDRPKSDILDIPNIKFFPTITDHQQQRNDYAILVSRIIVEYFEAFESLKQACIQHIPHQYTKEMSEKSSKVPLGVIFKNENLNEDMLEILQQFQTYLPRKPDGKYDGQLFAGDQLSVERAVNLISSVANGYTPEDRFEGIHLQIGDWHAGMKLLTMIYKRFYSGQSEVDNCTLFSDRTVINRRNVTADTKSSYRPNRDFLTIVLKSRVIAAAMKVLGIKDKSEQPKKHPLPPKNASKAQKYNYLLSVSQSIVDEYIFQESHVDQLVSSVFLEQERENIINNQKLTDDGRFPCRFTGCKKSFAYDGKSRRRHEQTHEPPPIIPEQAVLSSVRPKKHEQKTKLTPDDVFNYNCALLQDGFLFLNFLDAVSEGDGQRVIRQYKYIMMYCKADATHSTKYALECIYQFFLIYALLTPRDSMRFIWNRSVNNTNKAGNNIPLDLDVEHSNNFIKQAIKNLGPNVTEKAVSRICNSEFATRSIIGKIDEMLSRVSRSGRHTKSPEEKDLDELLKRVISENVFENLPGRTLTYYRDFQRDRLDNLDISEVYAWLNKHKKNVDVGIRAR